MPEAVSDDDARWTHEIPDRTGRCAPADQDRANMVERHLWQHEPRGYGWSCHSQIYGTGCTGLATWRHGTAPTQYLATYWCEWHKPMAEG